MPDRPADTTVAREVELAIRRLEKLSILPNVAIELLSGLFELKLTVPDLIEIVESEPALAVTVLRLSQKEISFTEKEPTIRGIIETLGLRSIRDEFLSSKIYLPLNQQQQKTVFRKHLVLFSIAVACCARDIAEFTFGQVDPDLAYTAGLLHNIGNLALDEAMPRSFAKIVGQAEQTKSNICEIQQKHLGLDYTIIGKRLAARWRLPEQITLAIWLHQTDTEVIVKNMPEAKIAQIVRLSYLLAQQENIGDSGSYEPLEPPEPTALSLGIDSENLQQICLGLSEKVSQKSKHLGLDSEQELNTYCKVVGDAVSKLSIETSKLVQENLRLRTKSSHFDFTTEFLTSISSSADAMEVAETFATHWQKFYQTGKVCLYLINPEQKSMCEAVIVDNGSDNRVLFLNVPEDEPMIPQPIQNNFAILDAQGHCDWLFEHLGLEFDVARTKIIPLLSKNKAIGVIAFEFHYPVETQQLQEMFKATTFIAAAFLDRAFASQKQQGFAEQFARLVRKPEVVEQPPITEKQKEQRRDFNDYISALAEMAAGAAHELNNPLSVIQGRTQLLAKAENEPQKKEVLKQIQENAGKLARTIEDLMGFAEPAAPRKTVTGIKQILDEALQLTSQKTQTEHINVQTELADDVEDVFVDSAQVVSAIANIFSNAVESYTTKLGPVKVAASKEGDFVNLQISDLGCGMDTETLQKAAYPFFSAKPAGRKRGMGLAYATRLIQINGGTLDISSQLGSGTTVIVSLPCK